MACLLVLLCGCENKVFRVAGIGSSSGLIAVIMKGFGEASAQLLLLWGGREGDGGLGDSFCWRLLQRGGGGGAAHLSEVSWSYCLPGGGVLLDVRLRVWAMEI